MGIKDLDNIFWWAEPLNRVNVIAKEGLPSGYVLNRQSFRSPTCARASRFFLRNAHKLVQSCDT